MKIVCSNSVVFAEEAFSTLGEVRLLPPREITAGDIRDADALVTRSTTRIDRDLLSGSSVRFVGTATIGTDHMDLDNLEEQGIAWTSASGCNANSVAEYFVSAMLCLANRHGMTLSDKMIGIVGLGHVGSRVMTMAEKLGMQVLLNDPPRERSEGGNGSGQGLPFLPLEFVLQQADIVTLHTPLTREGVDPTHHLAGPLFFDSLKQGCIFVNAARGAIVDTATLIRAIDRGTVGHAVIDTWEEEPAYSPELLARADLATPHIAGYSFDGLVNGTVRVYHEACRHFGVEPTWNPDALIPDPEAKNVTAEAGTSNRDVFLWDIVRQAYDIEADDRAMRDTCAESANERGRAFEQLRKNYPVRREFHASTTHLTTDQEGMGEILAGLGFSCSTYT